MAVVSCAACGGTDDPIVRPAETTPPPPRDAAKLAQSICDYADKCNITSLRQYYSDLAACAKSVNAEVSALLIAPGNAITQAELEACIAKVGVTCRDTFSTVPECDFRGTMPEGAACVFDSQCATGSCYAPDDAKCGVCQPRLGVGASCVSAECERGLECIDTKCVKREAENGPCTSSVGCIGELFCVQNKCVPPLGRGAPCKLDGTTSSCFENRSSLACVDGMCKDATLVKLNDPCGPTTVCAAATCTSFAKGGTCVAFLLEGAPCVKGGPACDPQTSCIAGVCTRPDYGVCQ